MNGIFFLLPFLAIVSFGLIQDSFAAVEQDVVGINYFDVVNPDGTHTWSSHHEYILDNGIYVPYVQNGLTVNSKIGDVILNADGSYTWNGKFTDKIIAKYSDVTDQVNWTYPDSLNDAVPTISFSNGEFVSSKLDPSIGLLEYKYIFNNGMWKTQLEATNLSGLTTKVFGFDQIIDLNTDSIEIDGRIYNIDDFDGVVLSKLFLDNNKGKVLNLMNGVNFDFDLGYENLYSVTIHDTGVNSSQLVLDYRTNTILLPNETLVIDPTFGYTSGTLKSPYSASGACSTNDGGNAAGIVGGETTYCYYNSVEWDTSSIADGSTVTNINVKYDISASTNSPVCNAVEIIGAQPSVSSYADLQTAIEAGDVYVDMPCATTYTDEVVVLGSQANTDLENLLTSDWFAIGMIRTPNALGSVIEANFDDTELEVTYTEVTNPDAVTDLTSTGITSTTVSLDWTTPGAGSGTIVGYQINATTPQTGNPLVWLNDTGSTDSDHIVTGLSSFTDYSFRVSAWTEVGNNATGNVYNATTTNPLPSQPTGLVATASSESIIGLDWDDSAIPTIDNITGYRIFQESPTGNGFIKLVNDTGTSTSSYSDTGLTTKTQYNYMVAGINATGVGSNSTASSDYTWGVPDAITGFTIINALVDSLDPDYTASVPYGYEVTGYETLRDNVFLIYQGNVTTFTDGSLSSGTSYDYSIRALSSFGNSTWVNATGVTVTGPPTGLTVNDCYHTCSTQLNLEWVAPVPGTGINGYRIFSESPIGNGFTTLVSNTTTTILFYNDTGLTPGVFYNYKVAALSSGVSDNSTAYAASPHKLSDWITDLVVTPNDLLQFDAVWTQPDLWGTLLGYQINYTTPAGDPQTIYTSLNPGVTATISGLNPTVEYSFRVASNTNHGINASGSNIANATASSEIAVGDLSFDPGTNADVEPVWFENYIVDANTNDVQVRFSSALTLDCTITERIANNVSTYTGIAETAATGYVYHNFTVTNAGNDILDWDCYDQTDSTINGQYALSQDQSAIGAGGVGNIPLFSLMGNFTGGLYGTEGEFAGIDLITLFIVIISMLGFNKKNPALGVGVMATLLGAAWYYGLIPWTSGVLGALAVVLVLAIGQGIKRD